jgi:hypothetical protein
LFKEIAGESGKIMACVRLNEPVGEESQTISQRLERFDGATAHVGRRGGNKKIGPAKICWYDTHQRIGALYASGSQVRLGGGVRTIGVAGLFAVAQNDDFLRRHREFLPQNVDGRNQQGK